MMRCLETLDLTLNFHDILFPTSESILNNGWCTLPCVMKNWLILFPKFLLQCSNTL